MLTVEENVIYFKACFSHIKLSLKFGLKRNRERNKKRKGRLGHKSHRSAANLYVNGNAIKVIFIVKPNALTQGQNKTVLRKQA